nr:hypothetical protein [Tanacetum cinerariifolium]
MVELHQHLVGVKGLASAVHLIEQPKDGLASQLGHGLADGHTLNVPVAYQLLVERVDQPEHVLGAFEVANEGRGLHQQVVEALALGFGVGLGGAHLLGALGHASLRTPGARCRGWPGRRARAGPPARACPAGGGPETAADRRGLPTRTQSRARRECRWGRAPAEKSVRGAPGHAGEVLRWPQLAGGQLLRGERSSREIVRRASAQLEPGGALQKAGQY